MVSQSIPIWRKLWRPIFGAERRKQLRRLVTPRPAPRIGPRWSRIVMRQETETLLRGINPATLDAVEISGEGWKDLGFKSYQTADFPEYDVCERPLPNPCDLVIAEQVFEHVLWPYRAGRNVLASLRPGGYFMISTPFLLKIHNFPVDCCRWTEIGLKHFLAECGFPLDQIKTGSWGNLDCVVANLHWLGQVYDPAKHSLENQPDFPYHVWALARKAT